MSRLLIGWAEESIVPEKKASLAGQFFERISEYVESEITVTAMAVESERGFFSAVSLLLPAAEALHRAAAAERCPLILCPEIPWESPGLLFCRDLV